MSCIEKRRLVKLDQDKWTVIEKMNIAITGMLDAFYKVISGSMVRRRMAKIHTLHKAFLVRKASCSIQCTAIHYHQTENSVSLLGGDIVEMFDVKKIFTVVTGSCWRTNASIIPIGDK